MQKINQKAELEKLVLSGVLNYPNIFHQVSQVCYPEMFSDWRQKAADHIWTRMENFQNVSHHTLALDLESKERAFELYDDPNDNALEFAHQLQQAFYTISEISRLNEAVGGLMEGQEYAEVVRHLNESRDDMESRITPVTKDEKIYTDTAFAIRHPEKVPQGISTGFATMDKLTGGFRPASYIIIAGRPGMGKTTILLQHIIFALLSGKKVALFSIEMTAQQILTRLAAMLAGYNPDNEALWTKFIRNKVADKILEIYDMPLTIYDGSTFSTKVEDLVRLSAQIKHTKGLEMVCIDYIQKLSTYKNFRSNTVAEMTHISNILAVACQQIQLPFLVLSQLSREVEKRASKRPIMADLRESGALEQDATEIWFVYRPEYYGIQEDAIGLSTTGLIEYINAKSRFAGNNVKDKHLELMRDPSTGCISEGHPGDKDFSGLPAAIHDNTQITVKADPDMDLPF